MMGTNAAAAATTKDSCDFTAPIPHARRVDAELARMRAEWDRTARYMVVRTENSTCDRRRSIVGRWLPLAEARKAAADLAAQYHDIHPYDSSWKADLYGIELHQPSIHEKGRAAVGDIVIYETVIPIGEFALGGTQNYRTPLVIAVAAEVDGAGRPSVLRDHRGRVLRQRPKKYWIVPACEIDVQAALESLRAIETDRDHWGVEHVSYRTALAQLRPFMHLQEPVYPERIPVPVDRLVEPFQPVRRFAVHHPGAAVPFTDFAPSRHIAEVLKLAAVEVEIRELSTAEPGCYFAWKRVDGGVFSVSPTIDQVHEDSPDGYAEDIRRGYGKIVPVIVIVASGDK